MPVNQFITYEYPRFKGVYFESDFVDIPELLRIFSRDSVKEWCYSYTDDGKTCRVYVEYKRKVSLNDLISSYPSDAWFEGVLAKKKKVKIEIKEGKNYTSSS